MISSSLHKTVCFLTLFGKREPKCSRAPLRSLVRSFFFCHSLVDVSRCRRAGLAQFDSLRETVCVCFFSDIDVCVCTTKTQREHRN